MLLVALGTSETAGWTISRDEPYSPQLAHPARYADRVCMQLGRPIVLHSYYPSQLGNELAPISWWIDKVSHDPRMRSDLEEADIVVMWALSVHDSVMAMILPGACMGTWPDPLQGCLEGRLSEVPARTDELFGLIAALVPSGALVLASDAYAPPFIVSTLDAKAHRDEIQALLDPYEAVRTLAPKYGFVFVDTELAFNGESRREMPAAGLFQSDALHPTEAGAQLIASTYLAVDGIQD